MDRLLQARLTRAVDEDGLSAAALVDRDGRTIALAGAVSDEEAMPLAALVMYRLKSPDLAQRLFAGEVVSVALEEREIAVAVAKRQLFVIAVMPTATPEVLAQVAELRDDVAGALAEERWRAPWGDRGDGGGGGAGPAELELVELGITVSRGKA